MKILTVWLFVCLCLLVPGEVACAGMAESRVPRHTFAIGAGVSRFDNEEAFHVSDYVDPQWEGWMVDVVGSYTFHHNIMIHAGVDYSAGDLDYSGQTARLTPQGEEGRKRVEKTADSETVDCRGLLGYDYLVRGKHVVTPFLGMGYRYWKEERGGEGGYERKVAYWYSPVGVKTLSPLSDVWTWGMSAEYDLFLDGEVDSDIPGMPTFHTDSGYGARFSLSFSRPLTKELSVSFEPYITYWDIDASDEEIFALPGGSDLEGYTVYSFIEPENTTITCGLRIRMEF